MRKPWVIVSLVFVFGFVGCSKQNESKQNSILLPLLSSELRTIAAGGRSTHDVIYYVGTLGAFGESPNWDNPIEVVSIERGVGASTGIGEKLPAEILRFKLLTNKGSHPVIHAALIVKETKNLRNSEFLIGQQQEQSLENWKHAVGFMPKKQ